MTKNIAAAILSPIAWIVCLGSISELCAKDPGLNCKEDGGPGVYTSQTPGQTGDRMVTPEVAQRFPVAQRSAIHILGGGVRGFGMLAEFAKKAPAQVVVVRRTQASPGEPFTPVALARVFDPKGNLAAVADFTSQEEGTDARVIDLPEGESGVWRVSFSGGRKGDVVEIRLPQTPTWGVRGEMALVVSEGTPKPAYLWIPPISLKLMMGIESGGYEGIVIEGEKGCALSGKPVPEPANRTTTVMVDPVPAGTVCRVVFPEKFHGAIDFEGAPGLLCPTPEAARKLAGGTVQCGDIYVSGPLQARARNWMVAHAAKLDRHPDLHWPQVPGDDVAVNPVDVLPYGKYGGLNGLQSEIENHNANLDPSKTYFGVQMPAEMKPGEEKEACSWYHFLHPEGGKISLTEAANYAALYTLKSPWNPAYGNDNILQRAILSGLFQISAMQGDDLLRDTHIFGLRYPITHTFFVYPSLAEAYGRLKSHLSPEVDAIWRTGLIAVGDKAADHVAYHSNQWAGMMEGHIATYAATGEKRFLTRFEDQMRAYIENRFGPQSKLGLHPTGFFLEECGPDGNYERLNLYCLVSAFNTYKKLPEANEDLLATMRRGIERNLQFKSFFWLPQPDGSLQSPTALNCRTQGVICDPAYPGDIMTMDEFPLGAARYRLSKEPKSGIGIASTLSYAANTEAWQRKTLQECIRRGPSAFPGSSGSWIPQVAEVLNCGKMAQPVRLPFEVEKGTWSLPGLEVWKRGALYGVVFYDVVGADHTLRGVAGGGITALWTPGTGTIISSMQPSKPGHPVGEAAELTFASLFGTDAQGRLFYSGHERAQMHAIEAGRRFEIQSEMDKPVKMAFRWGYAMDENQLELTVSAQAGAEVPRSMALNLPLLVPAGATAELVPPSSLVFNAGGHKVAFEWPAHLEAKLEPSTLPNIKRLVVPLDPKGEPLTIRIRPLP